MSGAGRPGGPRYGRQVVWLNEEGPALNEAIAGRSAEIVEQLQGLDERELLGPSRLPTWSRLTIACHLRYGAEALVRMTNDARAGEATSYYPAGRAAQREATLSPGPGETPADVVDTLAAVNEQLYDAWSGLTPVDWPVPAREPAGNVDLGQMTLVRLALLRLSEVEVHGSDLGLGLDDWSELFVQASLPFRLDWLNNRRADHRAFEAGLEGSWLLTASDGPTYLVSVRDAEVASRPAYPTTPADAVISGTSRDLLSLLLGRSTPEAGQISGDVAFGERFSAAFPGP